ncbi:MAG: hypothetical protein FD167_5906, partial [bacterium]
ESQRLAAKERQVEKMVTLKLMILLSINLRSSWN